MDNNIDKIIENILKVDINNLEKNIKMIIYNIKKSLNINKDLIEETNKLDINNKNGFILDFNIINNIFSNIDKDNLYYKDVTLSKRDIKENIIYGKEIMNIGNVIVINDKNPYILIEMIIRNIKAGNKLIIANNTYMYLTNKLIVKLVQDILEEFNISRNLIQLYVTDNYDSLLSNYANIDLVICIGNANLQKLILNKSKNKTIISGYENFDLYIDDIKDIDFLNKIINSNLDISLYINSNLNIDYPTAILVNDCDEAIKQINYNGSKFSSSIFTNSSINASKFINQVNSKIITVNTSPSIERTLDITQKDLITYKTIIYPFNFKLDDNIVKVEL